MLVSQLKGLSGPQAVAEISSAAADRKGNQAADLPFGPAFVREESAPGQDFALYGADARLRSGQGGAGAGQPAEASATSGELSASDQELLKRLQARDALVRRHEAAHLMAAGGQAAGMPTYTYQTGPDGRRYAIGGSLNISIMTTGDSEEDIRRAGNAARAAMASGDPSAADMRTAAKASAMQGRARRRAMESYAAQAVTEPWRMLDL